MEYCPDNYDAFCWHEAEKERELAKYSVCEKCGSPLYEYKYTIDGKVLCEDCEFDLYADDADVYDRLMYCEDCGTPLTDFVHNIDGETLCEECAKKSYGREVELDDESHI